MHGNPSPLSTQEEICHYGVSTHCRVTLAVKGPSSSLSLTEETINETKPILQGKADLYKFVVKRSCLQLSLNCLWRRRAAAGRRAAAARAGPRRPGF